MMWSEGAEARKKAVMAHVQEKRPAALPRFLLRGCRAAFAAGGPASGGMVTGLAALQGTHGLRLKRQIEGRKTLRTKGKRGKLCSEGHWPAGEEATAQQADQRRAMRADA